MRETIILVTGNLGFDQLPIATQRRADLLLERQSDC